MELFATAGITEPKLSRDPLGTEGEMSPGPDDQNPYDDVADAATDTGPAPPLLGGVGGGDAPLGGGDVVGEMEDQASERHGRAMSFFDPAPGHGSLDTDPESFAEHFRW